MKKRHFGHIEIPLQRVHIELTNVCDFNCTFCPKSEMTRPFGYMDTDLAKRIVGDIGEKGIADKITLHVMGEPTLHPDFFSILAYAQDKKVKVGLTTNGGGLGAGVGKRLLDYGPHQIDISLQTPDAGSFTLRKARSLSFDAYLDGIMTFFDAYNAKWPETFFKFRFLNTQLRKKEIDWRKGPVRVISSTRQLRRTFCDWAGRIYDMRGVNGEDRETAMTSIEGLSACKWNVVEVYPNVFFETYVLEDWGNAFGSGDIRDAWAGYCFGMRDHFGILYNGDLTLCCVDFDGKTVMGNLNTSSLEEVLSTPELDNIMRGFRRLQLVHPHCRRCLGSSSFTSWLLKPILSIAALKTLKPFFYKHTRLFR